MDLTDKGGECVYEDLENFKPTTEGAMNKTITHKLKNMFKSGGKNKKNKHCDSGERYPLSVQSWFSLMYLQVCPTSLLSYDSQVSSQQGSLAVVDFQFALSLTLMIHLAKLIPGHLWICNQRLASLYSGHSHMCFAIHSSAH